MSYLVAIETSHSRGSVALGRVDGTGEVQVEHFPPGLVHARELHPAIAAIVAASRIDRAEVAAIAVSQGPGSYTGIRVGVAAAKSLAWALEIPAVGVSSLAAIGIRAAADPAAESHEEFAVIVDARRGSAYAARFRRSSSRVERVEDDRLVQVDRYLGALDPSVVLVGSGARILPGAERFQHLPESLDCPDASSIFRLGVDSVSTAPTSPHDLMPVYFRPSEAEERRAARRAQADESARTTDRPSND